MAAAIASPSFSCSISVTVPSSRIPLQSTLVGVNLNSNKSLRNLSTSRFYSSKFQSATVCCNFFNRARSRDDVFSSNNLTTYRRFVRVYVGRRDEEENEFGMYPWEASSFNNNNNPEALQWVQEDTITLFTTDGLVQIGGSLVPRRINSSQNNQGRLRASNKQQRFQEEDYMDPSQGLCLGAIFDIAATNGLDLGRRFCIFGFCRSIEMLSDVVEDTVLEQGGEVVIAEKESKGGLQEKLTMTVAVPLLWGIPPAAERLRFAVRTGGGIVEKIYWQWNF